MIFFRQKRTGVINTKKRICAGTETIDTAAPGSMRIMENELSGNEYAQKQPRNKPADQQAATNAICSAELEDFESKVADPSDIKPPNTGNGVSWNREITSGMDLPE